MGSSRQQAFAEQPFWDKEFRRQFEGIRGAIRSLQLQAKEQKDRFPGSKYVQKNSHSFDCLDRAFIALNEPEPPEKQPSGDFIPGRRKRKTLNEELDLAQ